MNDTNKKKIFAALCGELGRLQEDVNAYRSDEMKKAPVEAECVAEDFNFHVNCMIGILQLFDMEDIQNS